MLIMSGIFFVCVSSISAKPSNTVSDALILAISSSFENKTNLLHVMVQSSYEENKFIFSDLLHVVLNKKFNFKIQLDVNNEETQAVGDFNLWFIDSYECFVNLRPLIQAHEGDNPVFYLIFLKAQGIAIDLIKRLFADMFLLMVVNVNIVIEEPKSSDEVIFYTYAPYRETACNSTEPLELLRFGNNSLMLPQELNPEKAVNLHGCLLNIVTRNPTFFRGVKIYKGLLEVGGLEIKLLEELSRRMNFEVQLIEQFTYEMVLYVANGTGYGAYKLIEENKAQIMIGFYKHGPLQDRYNTPSPTYFFNWVAISLWRPPKTFRKISWLFIPFDAVTWVWCLLLLLLATCSIYTVTKTQFLVNFLDIETRRNHLTNAASMALGISIQPLPKTNFIRLCFVVWSIATLTIRATYEGKLFDSYRSMTHSKIPLTVRQLLVQNYTIYSQFTYRFVLGQLGGIGTFTYKKLPIEKVLTSGQRNAVIASFVYMYEVYDPEEMENMIMEPLFYEHCCLFMKKHSILAPKVNDIIARMEEAGLLNRWREHYEVLKTINFALDRDGSSGEPSPIALKQFKYTLLLFAPPIIIAVVVFVAELYWEGIQKWRYDLKRKFF